MLAAETAYRKGAAALQEVVEELSVLLVQKGSIASGQARDGVLGHVVLVELQRWDHSVRADERNQRQAKVDKGKAPLSLATKAKEPINVSFTSISGRSPVAPHDADAAAVQS